MIFKGRVQGVGFRYTACMIANKYNLTGYVENLVNEDVRVEVQGNKESIDIFLKEILNSSNHWIRIEDYSIKEIDIDNNENSFITKY